MKYQTAKSLSYKIITKEKKQHLSEKNPQEDGSNDDKKWRVGTDYLSYYVELVEKKVEDNQANTRPDT